MYTVPLRFMASLALVHHVGSFESRLSGKYVPTQRVTESGIRVLRTVAGRYTVKERRDQDEGLHGTGEAWCMQPFSVFFFLFRRLYFDNFYLLL